MSTKKYDMDCRREVAYTSNQVKNIYRQRVLGGNVVRVTFATAIAYALQILNTAIKKGPLDFEYYKKAPASDFGVTDKTLNCPNIRYRTSFNASPSLIAQLDAAKQIIQQALAGQGKINRNFVVAVLFRIVIDYDQNRIHLVEPTTNRYNRHACFSSLPTPSSNQRNCGKDIHAQTTTSTL